MPNEILNLLLATQALEIAPPFRPFWYTSGTIGPFYLNAHYLYGSRPKAEELLHFIDQNQRDRATLIPELFRRVQENYSEDAGYRAVIESVAALARNDVGVGEFEVVSGGERRDWFFSLMVALSLGKPALLICKNQEVFQVTPAAEGGYRVETSADLKGVRVLHVADLATEGSSYVRAWIPALEKRGAKLAWAMNVIDRGQGAEKVLEQHGVQARHLVQIGASFFRGLQELGYLSEQQATALIAYHVNPRECMKGLLLHHPEILREALRSPDAKIQGRARILMKQNVYGFEDSFWVNLKS